MAAIRRAFLLASADRYMSVVINFSAIIVLSRLLSPREIGLWVICSAVVVMASSAREFASYNFLIQQKELSREDIRSAFTVMLALTVLIAAALSLLAPWIAAAYQEDSVVPYLRVMAVSLLFEVVAAPIVALLRRDLAFGKVAIINVLNAAVSAGAAVLLAAFGYSYMSFAWASLLAAAATSVLALWLRPGLWVFKPSLSRWAGPLTFGSYYGTNTVLYRANDSLLYLLVGRIISVDAVGLYNRGVMVSQIPDKLFFGGVASLVVPAFSVEVREGRNPKHAYLRAVEYTTAVQWPALLLLAILARPAVEIVLGSQWLGVVTVVQILAVAALFSFTAQLDYAVLIAVGAMRANLCRALIVVSVSALSLIVAAFFGLTAMALSQLLVVPLEAYVSFWFLRQYVPITWREVGAATWKSASLAACSAICAAAVAQLHFDRSIVMALAAGTASVVGWFAALRLTQHALLGEIGVVTIGLRRIVASDKRLGPALGLGLTAQSMVKKAYARLRGPHGQGN
jgi:O-antigen/teichoic acid export membrane protein